MRLESLNLNFSGKFYLLTVRTIILRRQKCKSKQLDRELVGEVLEGFKHLIK